MESHPAVLLMRPSHPPGFLGDSVDLDTDSESNQIHWLLGDAMDISLVGLSFWIE
jgi:hypothetical protein